MPLFEYVCLDCRRISEHLVFREEDFEPYCLRCGSRKVKKLISRVRVKPSLDSRLDRLTDPSLLSGLDEEDPKTVMKVMEKMGAEFGEELGDEFDEVMTEAREELESELSGGKESSSEEVSTENED